MMVEVPHHLVVLLLRDLAPGVPRAQDVVALVAVPVAAPGVPPAPGPEEPAHGPEQREEREEKPEPVEWEPRTRRTGRQGAEDQPHDDRNNEDSRQQDERRPTPHSIETPRFPVHFQPRPHDECTAVALEPVGGMPRDYL